MLISRYTVFVAMFVVLLGSYVIMPQSFAADVDTKPGKVIWITIDTLRAENLHFMGYERETSPWMDSLAEKSVVFEWAISPSHSTIMSVPSYMTGKYQSELYHNAFHSTHLPDKFKLLAESFKERGFKTHWYSCNGNAGGHNQAQGIDEHHMIYPQGVVNATIDEMITIARMNYTQSDKPEFIYFHTNDVHDPYRPPIPYDKMFGPKYKKSVVREGFALDEDRERFFSNIPYLSETSTIDQHDIDFLIGQYDGVIKYTDSKLGEVLDVFNFDYDHDMLIITADHGEQFFEHGFLGHGRSLRSQDFHVPLIIYYAGFKTQRYSKPVSLIDLYPTLAEIFELEAPQGLRGTSLLPVLMGMNPDPHYAVGESADWRGRAAVVVYDKYWYAFNTQAWKLRPWLEWPYMEMLFDLEKDPKCITNLSETLPDVAAQYNKEMCRLHERYLSYNTKAMDRKRIKPEYGPNRFDDVPANKEAWEKLEDVPLFKIEGDNTLAINYPRPHVAITAPTTPGFKYHLFGVDVDLKSGWLTLEMKRTDTGATLWKHQFRKPGKRSKPFRRAFYPKTTEVRLLVYMEKSGKATIGWPSLRESNIPIVWPKRWPVQIEKPEEVKKETQSDADKARLEALGYL